MKSDLRNAATVVESYHLDHEAYPGGWADIAPDVKRKRGVVVRQ